MRILIATLIVIIAGARSPALAAEALTFEVLSGEDRVLEKLVVPASQIASVESGFASSGEPVLQFRLKSDARKRFGKLTQRHIGKRVRLRVGKEVLIAGAFIREPILGGSVQVSGFSAEKTEEIKKKLGR